MKKTTAEKRIEEMTSQGYQYLGMTTGLPSTRKGSNLYRKVEQLGQNINDVTYVTGAHLQRGTQGWQLLIFKKVA